MKKKRNDLSRRYLAALRRYLADGSRAGAKSAERLGGQALSAGLGTLDLASIHEQAMAALPLQQFSTKSTNGRVTEAAAFFVEALAPIERTRRAVMETNTRLNQVNGELRVRTAELAAANTKLKKELSRHQVMERALKKSELRHQQLFEQSHQMREHLRRLSHKILSGNEAERKEISRELHDEIGQSLTGINLALAALTKGARNLKKIARTQRLVEKLMESVHQFARKLRPAILDDLGLVPALHSLVKEFVKRARIPVRFTAIAAIQRLDSEKRTVLYRVTQEALANIAKHAQATRASVKVTRQLDGAICLEIHDNGKSFQEQRVLRAKENRGLGLLGMRERVEMVGGRFTVISSPGRGATIRAQIPFMAHGSIS